jgi:hypothetical protein
MTDSLDEPPQLDELGDEDSQELEPTGVPDESVEGDTEGAHPVPYEDELAMGQALGEEIDTEDDEDSGIGEPDELRSDEKVSPYAGEEVVQDADVVQ